MESDMTILRILAAVFLFVGLVLLLAYDKPTWIYWATGLLFFCEVLVQRSIVRCVRHAAPMLLFCAVLAILELIARQAISMLALKALVSYFVFILCVRMIPWPTIVYAAHPRSRAFVPALYLLIVRHFIFILRDETLRSLTAYRLAVPRVFARGGVRALAYCLENLLHRCLQRAERFYAAQLLRGIAE
jgi:hypothetical protein